MKKGFTLIELMVVIAIIGILSGVIIASLGSSRARARDGKRVSDIGQIQLALELYYEQNRKYPTTISTDTDLSPVYMNSVPKDPVGGVDYKYAVNSATSPTNYHLGAILEQMNPASYNANENFFSCATGVSWTSGFRGDSQDCLCSASVPGQTDKCYDVKGR